MFCSHLYLLARDNLTCVEDRVILLLSVLTEIRGVDLDQPPLHALPAPSRLHPTPSSSPTNSPSQQALAGTRVRSAP